MTAEIRKENDTYVVVCKSTGEVVARCKYRDQAERAVLNWPYYTTYTPEINQGLDKLRAAKARRGLVPPIPRNLER